MTLLACDYGTSGDYQTDDPQLPPGPHGSERCWLMTEPSNGDVGAWLRAARERSGRSLRQIADSTKLSVRTLDMLERNRVSQLPGGIYRRAIVRSYASEIGLDPETTLRLFLARYPQDDDTAIPEAAPEPNAPATRPDAPACDERRWRLDSCRRRSVLLFVAPPRTSALRGRSTPPRLIYALLWLLPSELVNERSRGFRL